ncbi:hypothetical protein JTB14_033227 [Gonioctena quinquepunctata]|nr:hypothetical protein JTB14_033227 [Gonioctena quinquepunctata]
MTWMDRNDLKIAAHKTIILRGPREREDVEFQDTCPNIHLLGKLDGVCIQIFLLGIAESGSVSSIPTAVGADDLTGVQGYFGPTHNLRKYHRDHGITKEVCITRAELQEL